MNKLVYDYNPDGTTRPMWFVTNIETPISVSSKKYYIDLAHYDSIFVGDLVDDLEGCTITMNELTTGRTDNEVGIDLELLRRRIGAALDDVERFVLLAADVEEVLRMGQELIQ